jgi:hypothetical protein
LCHYEKQIHRYQLHPGRRVWDGIHHLSTQPVHLCADLELDPQLETLMGNMPKYWRRTKAGRHHHKTLKYIARKMRLQVRSMIEEETKRAKTQLQAPEAEAITAGALAVPDPDPAGGGDGACGNPAVVGSAA